MTRANQALFEDLDIALRESDPSRVAVIGGGSAARLKRLLRSSYPQAKVSRYRLAIGESALHARLTARGRFDVIIDNSRGADRAQLLKNVFLHLRPGGSYLVTHFRPRQLSDGSLGARETVWQLVSRLIEIRNISDPAASRAELDDAMLSASIAAVAVRGQHLVLTNQRSALAKLTEAELRTVLGSHRPRLGRVLEELAACELTSRSTLSETPSQRNGDRPISYQVPSLSLREHHDVFCASRQVVFQQNLVLTDTYRHNRKKRLRNAGTKELVPRFIGEPNVADAERLAGAYFYLDSEFRGHFGHAITEQMSRLWAWPQAKRDHPDLKAVLTANHRRPELFDFEIELYSAAGIPPGDLVLLKEPTQLETLIAATPMFCQPAYIHPDITHTWERVGNGLVATAPEHTYPQRIFCARRIEKRPCCNAKEVEAVFDAAGFAVIYPEDYSLGEQVMLFRTAEVIAGYAGSALFNTCFSVTPKHLIMICSESYTAINEYMIAAVMGHHVDVLWCAAEVKPKPGRWDPVSFHSPFAFDFDRDGETLSAILDSL